MPLRRSLAMPLRRSLAMPLRRSLWALCLGLFVLLFAGPHRAEAAGETPAVRVAETQLNDAPPAGNGAWPKDALEVESGVKMPVAPEGFNTYDGGWLRVAFPASKRHRIQPLIQDADAFRERLRDLFGYDVLNHVVVHVARTTGEMVTLAPEGSPFPQYAEGVAYPGLNLILLTIEPKYPNSAHDLAEVFRHELAHLALNEAVEKQHVPLWLNEGFAIHLSGESSLARMQTLWTATLSETLIPLSHLDRHFPDDIVQTPVAYAESADVVRHLLRTRYSQRFVAMLRRVRGGEPFVRAMSDAYGFEVYGVGSNSLEDEWRRDVAKRYSFWPVLFSGSMVWVGALGLFVVGYYRRRKQQRVTLERWAVEEAAADRQAATVLAARAPSAARMHIVLAPKEAAPEAVLPEFKRTTRDVDVPKVEHEGSWHTLH
jgi:Peptidase MA superfamily